VFERFTERARQVVVLAQDEARALKHNYIGTEHILLGLLREEEGLAARILELFGIGIEDVRGQVGRIVGWGDEPTVGQLPFTPRAKKVLELSLREALKMGHNYIGTEHVLLGLVRENEGVAARILVDFGADAESIRNEVIRMLSGPGPSPERVDVPPELVQRIEGVRAEKEAAIEAGEWERAASLRDEERRLAREARGLAPLPPTPPMPTHEMIAAPSFGKPDRLPLVAALIVAAAGFPLGLLAGWAIWG
jgi:hypothetical protein